MEKKRVQRILEHKRLEREMKPIISRILNEEDPMRLRAPKDEYSSEAKSILGHLWFFKPTKVEVIRNFIYSTFTLSFCIGWNKSGRLALWLSPVEVRRMLGPKKNWDHLAQRVYEALKEKGWVDKWAEEKKRHQKEMRKLSRQSGE